IGIGTQHETIGEHDLAGLQSRRYLIEKQLSTSGREEQQVDEAIRPALFLQVSTYDLAQACAARLAQAYDLTAVFRLNPFSQPSDSCRLPYSVRPLQHDEGAALSSLVVHDRTRRRRTGWWVRGADFSESADS